MNAVAPGGQAGTTSMIENYLGFPTASVEASWRPAPWRQPRRFGAEILLARPLVDLDGRLGVSGQLSDGTSVLGRTLLLATGVEWRRLEVPGIDESLGAGVYYGAGRAKPWAVPGRMSSSLEAGNFAGQAVVRSSYAVRVTLLWYVGRTSPPRCRSTSSTPSRVFPMSTCERGLRSWASRPTVSCVKFSRRRQRITLHNSAGRRSVHLHRGRAAHGRCRRDRTRVTSRNAGYVPTGSELTSFAQAQRLGHTSTTSPLETNLPGLFAAGDVRRG